MRVGLDCLLLRGNLAGSRRYFQQTLQALIAAPEVEEVVVFSTPETVKHLQPDAKVRFVVVNQRPWPAALAQQTTSCWRQARSLDVLHTPGFAPPRRFAGPTVITLFDLVFAQYPATMKWTNRLWWRLLGTPALQRADHVVVISQFVYKEATQILQLPPERVSVVYPYAPSWHTPTPDALQRIVQRYHLPLPFILFVGTLEPRKNLSFLLRVFAHASQMQDFPHHLVLVGPKGWHHSEPLTLAQQLNIAHRVHQTGYVPETDLIALYHLADAFCLFSHYEGFGYPLLEAMSTGTPVLATDTASLPEIVGEAGYLVPNGAVEIAARQLITVLTDSTVRQRLSQLGKQRARLFSQQQFATGLLRAYQSAREHYAHRH